MSRSHTTVMAQLANIPVLLLLIVLSHGTPGAGYESLSFDNNFESSSEGWNVFRGHWRWTNRNSLSTNLPPNNPGGDDGFMVMDTIYKSDELYTDFFTAPLGGFITINYFLRSEYQESNLLRVVVRDELQDNETLLEIPSSSTTYHWDTQSQAMGPKSGLIRVSIPCNLCI